MPKPKRQTPNWKDVLNELRRTISDDSVQRWFSATRLEGIRNGTAKITVPNNIYQLWIEANYREVLVSALQALDPTIHNITVRVEEPTAEERNVRRPKVFVSYSHRDHAILERLLIHLRPLDRELAIETWTDRKISYGSDWRHELQHAIKDAEIAILLISADFLASDFIMTEELPSLLERAESNGARILPLICKPCRFVRTPHLARFQAVNDPKRPLLSMDETEREAIFTEVAEIVGDACKNNTVA